MHLFEHKKFLFFFKPLLPLCLLVLLGLIFRKEVQHSYEAMPHPALLLAIFAVALLGVVLVLRVQYITYRESVFLERGVQNLPETLSHTAAKTSSHGGQAASFFDPVMRLLSNASAYSDSRMFQTAVTHELDSAGRKLLDLTEFPGYVSGALVGMGLLGTFIGLIETLGNLVGLFGSLSGMQDANADLVLLFSNLITRLQDPMKAMATAFIASLYGLLLSMMLGFMLSILRGNLMRVMDQAQEAVSHGVQGILALDGDQGGGVAADQGGRWTSVESAQVLQQMWQEYRDGVAEVTRLREQTAEALSCFSEINQRLADRLSVDELFKNVLGSGVHWFDAIEQLRQQTVALTQHSERVSAVVSDSVGKVGDLVAAFAETSARRDADFKLLLSQLSHDLASIVAVERNKTNALNAAIARLEEGLVRQQASQKLVIKKVNALIKDGL